MAGNEEGSNGLIEIQLTDEEQAQKDAEMRAICSDPGSEPYLALKAEIEAFNESKSALTSITRAPIEELCEEVALPESVVPLERKVAMERADANGDGQLSIKELATYDAIRGAFKDLETATQDYTSDPSSAAEEEVCILGDPSCSYQR